MEGEREPGKGEGRKGERNEKGERGEEKRREWEKRNKRDGGRNKGRWKKGEDESNRS